MSSNAIVPRYVSKLPHFQVVCWIVMCLPSLQKGGGLEGLGFFQAILMLPFLALLALSFSARQAARTRRSPASIGKVWGCFAAGTVGVGVSLSMSAAIHSSH